MYRNKQQISLHWVLLGAPKNGPKWFLFKSSFRSGFCLCLYHSANDIFSLSTFPIDSWNLTVCKHFMLVAACSTNPASSPNFVQFTHPALVPAVSSKLKWIHCKSDTMKKWIIFSNLNIVSGKFILHHMATKRCCINIKVSAVSSSVSKQVRVAVVIKTWTSVLHSCPYTYLAQLQGGLSHYQLILTILMGGKNHISISPF